MTDNELIKLFRPIIVNALLLPPYSNVIVKQNNQPTMQGANTAPTIYFNKVGDHRYGFLGRYDNYDPASQGLLHNETQVYETTFQVSALVRQDPKNTDSFTASDLVNQVSMIINSDAARDAMQQQGVGLLRILDVTNPFFTDDRDQFEASPSFDFTLTHKRISVTTPQVVDYFNVNIKRV